MKQKYGIALLLCLLLASVGHSERRDDILSDVRQAAKRHVNSGSGKDSKYALDMWGKNSAGVTPQEILRAYDEEYSKDKEEQDRWNWIPKAGWPVAALLFIGLIFVDKLKQAVGKFFEFLGEKLFTFFAGIPWFYRLPLNRYRKRMIERYSQLKIPFRPERPLDLSAVFVPLKVSDAPQAEMIDAYVALQKNARLVVKGLPGSGKSILLRHIALTYVRPRVPHRFGLPILVELNRLNDPAITLRSELARELSTKGFPKPNRFLARELDRGHLLILLDGLDEVSAAQRPQVVKQIQDLLEEFPFVHLVVSCRTQVYGGELDISVDRTLEIQSFTDQQIRAFLRSWAADMRTHGKSVDQLMAALLERPAIMLLARNPLMLTIIAWLYTDTTVILPHSRSEFYRTATELLLYDWKRENNAFQLVPKQLVLRDLALYFQDKADQNQQDRRSMDVRTVLRRMGEVLPSLNMDPQATAKPLLDEIVQRSALLLAIDGGERYQFAHLTLQEYFAAAQLRSDPDGLIERFERDPDAWREPVKLWCGMDVDATKLIAAIYRIDPVTAFECLADAQKVDSGAAQTIIDSMKGALVSGDADSALVRAFGTVASSLSERGKTVFRWLTEQRTARCLEALSYTNTPQAASIFASLYESDPLVRPLMRRLGELAVPELSTLADRGNASAVNDLLAIGTPGAAVALTALLWHSSPELARRSGYALAALFRLPEVFAALREINVNHPAEASWVWEPFEAEKDTAIPIIAGRVVSLLATAHELPELPKATLDPRLVLPACAQAGSEIRLGQVPEDLRQLSIAELHRKLTGQAEKQPQQTTADQPSTEILERITKALFERLSPSKRVRFLFARLSLPIRSELVRGISSTRIPNREDWVNVFRPISYTASRDWHLWLAFALVQAAAIGDMIYLLGLRRPISVVNIAMSAELLVGLLLQLVSILFGGNDIYEFLRCFGIGPATVFTYPLTISDLRTNAKNRVAKLAWAVGIAILYASVVGWAPVWLWASFLLSRDWVRSPFAIVACVPLYAASVALWYRARTLERLARNPLSGLRRFLRIEEAEPDQPDPAGAVSSLEPTAAR
ncbi:MAG: NACHT domain-containing protein [Acidobacteriaceae bacterium]|nr:NACHT domain-containing protein [Acidobacteriaceae bacterium]